MILLDTDKITIYAPTGEDSHGWATGPDPGTPLWSGRGSVQLGLGINGVNAATDGGAGPFEPNSLQQGEAYLPEDTGVHDGCVLTARGLIFVVSFTRRVPDPIGALASCVVVNLTEVREWLTPRLRSA